MSENINIDAEIAGSKPQPVPVPTKVAPVQETDQQMGDINHESEEMARAPFAKVDSTVKVNPEIARIGSGLSDADFIKTLAMTPESVILGWEDVSLPSDGIYYDGWENGVVRVRPMTQKVEKIFTNKRLLQSGQALEKLLEYCVQLPEGFSNLDLLVGDKTFLLYYIRGITFGNMYKFIATCQQPGCGAQSTKEYDMNELYSTVIPARPEYGPEPFKVSLPYLSGISNRDVWVGVRLLRSRDFADVKSRHKFNNRLTDNRARAGRSRQGQQPAQDRTSVEEIMLEKSLERTIVSVNGVTDPLVIRSIASNLHSMDNAAIRDFLAKVTPSIDTTVTINCPECGEEATIMLPFTEGFFRKSE